MREKIAALAFDDIPVAPPRAPERIKVAALSGGVIKITLNAAAANRFGRPPCIAAAGATLDGRHYLRLTAAEAGWKLEERTPPRGGTDRSFSICRIGAHPFSIGIVHGAHEVAADWSDDSKSVTLEMPNWERMLDEIDAAAPPPPEEEED